MRFLAVTLAKVTLFYVSAAVLVTSGGNLLAFIHTP